MNFEASAHFKVSDKTVRRWIQQKKVNAEQVDGRWIVHVDLDTDQPIVQPDVQVERMQSEIEHLRDALSRRDTQIDQQKPVTGDADATERSTDEPTPTAIHCTPYTTQIMVIRYVKNIREVYLSDVYGVQSGQR